MRKNVLIKYAGFLSALLLLSACDSITEVDSDDILAQRLLGETYCTKVPLFIRRWSEDDMPNHHEYLEFWVRPPMRDETTIEKHLMLAEKKWGYKINSVLLEENSKLTIQKVLLRTVFVYDGSGYYPLADVNGELFQGKLVYIGSLLMPPHPARTQGSEAVINNRYLEKC